MKTLRRITRIKKHEFGSFDMMGRSCIHCGKSYSLSDYQLEDLPVSMATCPKGKPIGIFEYLKVWWGGCLDCLPNKNIFEELRSLFGVQ